MLSLVFGIERLENFSAEDVDSKTRSIGLVELRRRPCDVSYEMSRREMGLESCRAIRRGGWAKVEEMISRSFWAARAFSLSDTGWARWA